jgi:hypothetical protein
LTTANKKVKKIDELVNKLKNDKEQFILSYQRPLGEYLTRETLKILDDFMDFLEVSPEMISISCSKLREFNGPSFTVATAKALINLRCDLSKDEKNEAISTCKQILDNFSQGGNSKSSGFFDHLENEIKIQENLERQEDENAQNLEEVEEIKEKRRKTINLTDFLNLGVDINDLEGDEKEEKEDSIIITSKNPSIMETTIDTDVVFEGVMEKKSYNT